MTARSAASSFSITATSLWRLADSRDPARLVSSASAISAAFGSPPRAALMPMAKSSPVVSKSFAAASSRKERVSTTYRARMSDSSALRCLAPVASTAGLMSTRVSRAFSKRPCWSDS